MAIRLLLSLALMLSPLPATPQTSIAPVQAAQAEEPLAAEESVVLPEVPSQTGLLIGVALAASVLLLSGTRIEACDDSSSCGEGPIFTAPTSTR